MRPKQNAVTGVAHLKVDVGPLTKRVLFVPPNASKLLIQKKEGRQHWLLVVLLHFSFWRGFGY